MAPAGGDNNGDGFYGGATEIPPVVTQPTSSTGGYYCPPMETYEPGTGNFGGPWLVVFFIHNPIYFPAQCCLFINDLSIISFHYLKLLSLS